jgi:diguanylate cyclase (GGDEF)-like protein
VPTTGSVLLVLAILGWTLASAAVLVARRARRSEHAALAVADEHRAEREATEGRLGALAAIDAQTGLLNHRSFHQRLEEEVGRALRHERPLSIVVLDLDRFKEINDRHGHPAGDRVLAEAARRITGVARVGEHVARVGGEEFALILPDADGVGGFAAAERVRQAIAARPFEDVGPLTISAGVCALATAGSAGELYRLADVALYWAKAHGRNMTFRYTPEVAVELQPAEELHGATDRARALASLRSLGGLVDDRHPSTTGHAERVAALAHALALEAGWTADRAQRLRDAALVHDVGKVALREEVLLKTEPLDEHERAHVETHAPIGARIVASVLDLEQVRWVRGHHERWDGTGYPDRLCGEEIPDGAALLALADAWDAMRSDRWYQSARDAEDALGEVRREAGRQFAPDAAKLLEGLAATGRLRRMTGVR